MSLLSCSDKFINSLFSITVPFHINVYLHSYYHTRPCPRDSYKPPLYFQTHLSLTPSIPYRGLFNTVWPIQLYALLFGIVLCCFLLLATVLASTIRLWFISSYNLVIPRMVTSVLLHQQMLGLCMKFRGMEENLC